MFSFEAGQNEDPKTDPYDLIHSCIHELWDFPGKSFCHWADSDSWEMEINNKDWWNSSVFSIRLAI